MNKALFLDRDGVINVDFGHVHTKENFIFIDGIFELCRLFQDHGYYIFVVTNQAGIGKGYYSKKTFIDLNSWMKIKFKEQGVEIMETYFCSHKPEDKCLCRKPKPGMLIDAINKYNIDVSSSFLIGDKQSDIDAGKSANIKNLIYYGYNNHFQTIEYISEILWRESNE